MHGGQAETGDGDHEGQTDEPGEVAHSTVEATRRARPRVGTGPGDSSGHGTVAVMTRPFRFGIQASKTGDRAGWVGLARRAEDLGYSALTMPDHFTDQLAPLPALMCAADATERLRVGALVWDNDYKHPVVLAKELATRRPAHRRPARRSASAPAG